MERPTLTRPTWLSHRAAHEARVDGLLGGHLEKRARHGRHTIEEFLLTYYTYRPAQLRRWHPGLGVELEDADPEEFGPFHVRRPGGHVAVDLEAILARRCSSIEWIRDLLRATAARPPQFGCFGMHEWAMVYRQSQEQTRHNILPLRLGADGTAAVVDRTPVRCTHFDAFRFFTDAARPLNSTQLTRDEQTANEQPGCLHTNMDVYKWSYKLAPLVSSELMADCFELAREIRTLDIRASPYDLSGIGLDTLPVETPDGKAEYVAAQRVHSEQAASLRDRLIAVCDTALAV